MANITGRYCGKTDLTLLPDSREALKRILFSLPSCDYIYTSNAKRAVQTAEILVPSGSVQRLDALREIDFGDFEGLCADEIAHRMPDAWQRYLDDYFNFTFPHGDNVRQYIVNAVMTARKIIGKHKDQHILIVGHKGFIMCVLSDLLHGDSAHLFDYDVKPGGFAWLNLDGHRALLRRISEGLR